MLIKLVTVVLIVLCKINCLEKKNPETIIIRKVVKEKIESFEKLLKSTQELEKQDGELMKNWTEERQLKVINVTAKYRLEVTRHKEHSFGGREDNTIWRKCIQSLENNVIKSELEYYEKETLCLKSSLAIDNEKKQAVEQIGKEIHKWRRSYKFIQQLCHKENPEYEEKARTCLVGYILADDCNMSLQRLIILRLNSMSDLYAAMTSSVTSLEECLASMLSHYLDSVRKTMDLLNRCYVKNVKF